MNLLGLTIDSSLPFKAHVKSMCNKVNVKVAALRRVRKFIPLEVLVKIYKAFILPHFKYCALVLVGLSSGLSHKLELTIILRHLHTVSYLCSHPFFYKCMYNMGLINIKMFIFRNNEYDLRNFNKLHQPAYNSRFMPTSYLYITSRLWNNLPDFVRRASSLNVFKTKLSNLNLTTRVKCYCNFCT